MSALRCWLFVALCLAAVFQPLPRGAAEEVIKAYVTFYGFDDNDDGDPRRTGTYAISDPSMHEQATEDLGTYDRPGTLAADKRMIAPGTVLYIPALQRYYVMEDTCRACSGDWLKGRPHVDVFVEGTGPPLAACEYRLTMEEAEIIVNPAPNLPVREGSACDSSRPPATIDRRPSMSAQNTGAYARQEAREYSARAADRPSR
ncbi:hypothetical protein V6C03_02165 [Methyloligella sp. 2.7D]|uniref:hypothetical protein n=1 Tax=unclassified Methyloligella TaxID=2625955 RepID=UPI00157BD5CE|nr:hypothetical protein [Methyloligella sp. GL2]QKP76559.1 hypothetical protein HT051_03255 [Methyloligella sp. GL2]